VHRKSSLPVILSRPCLAVLWMIQPDKLREMLGKAALTDSGMLMMRAAVLLPCGRQSWKPWNARSMLSTSEPSG